MKKRLKTKTIVVLIAVLALVTVLFLFSGKTSIALKGEENQTVEVFSEYKDSGYTASAGMLFLSYEPEVTVSGTVDTTKLGEYIITYKSTFGGEHAEVKRKVTVKDTVAPVIEVSKDEIIFEYTGTAPTLENINIECSALDNYDGDLSDKIQKSIKDNELIISVSDSSGNTATRSIGIVLNDGVQPSLTLYGSATVYVKKGATYKEAGFKATDDNDGDISEKVVVSGKVDTSKNGTYLIEYKVTDQAGNSVKRTRKVVVYSGSSANDFANVPKNGKTVYLTFDDGPGPYTEKLLEYLDIYNVKATFFVTSQFSGYKNLIGEAYSRGHAIGVHTATHKWDIYKSKESYLADFEKIQNVIKEQTGSRAEIFRFPGGTNNLVSKNHKKGIMTQLANDMVAMGYVYFDWNVDCEDSRYTNSQSIIESTIKQISNKTNSVVLMHDIKNYTVEAVPAIIEYCLQNGYTFSVLTKDSPPCSYKPQN